VDGGGAALQVRLLDLRDGRVDALGVRPAGLAGGPLGEVELRRQASGPDAQSINASIAKIQEAHLKGSTATVHDQSRALNTMINRVYRENAGVQQIEDADDLGGILRKRD
jgi:hypothetical protein